MRKPRVLALLLSALLYLGSTGTAESPWEALCRQHGLTGDSVSAWLEIPGADLCEPVMRHPADDIFYASHAPDGSPDPFGALFVQARYNAGDLSDPVTIIYGSSAGAGAPLRDLQESYSGSFDACRILYLHTPAGTQEYLVFAALPYSSLHILHYYNFRLAKRYDSFFDSVFSTRALGMHLDGDNRPSAGIDQVVILSTALRGDPLQRYLVMAKRISH